MGNGCKTLYLQLPVSDGDGGGSGGGVWRAVVGSREHEGKEVTSLAWDVASTEVYIADASGKVSVLYITRSKVSGFGYIQVLV